MPQKLKKAKTKSGRRGNNEGSIFQRKDGRWSGQVTVGYKTDGNSIRKTIYGQSRQEVARKIAEMTVEVNQNGYINVSARDERNFEVLCRKWFDIHVAPHIEDITQENRRNLLKNHIYKEFGTLVIEDISRDKVQIFLNNKAAAGVASDTVGKMRQLLDNFFTYAVDVKLVRANPVPRPKRRRRENKRDEKGAGAKKALRKEIRLDVLRWSAQHPLLKPIIIVFALVGLRPQELLPLKWEQRKLSHQIHLHRRGD